MTRATFLTMILLTACAETPKTHASRGGHLAHVAGAALDEADEIRAPSTNVYVQAVLETGLITMSDDTEEEAVYAVPVYMRGAEILPTISLSVWFQDVNNAPAPDCVVRFQHPAHQPIPDAWGAQSIDTLFGVTLDASWSVTRDTCVESYSAIFDFDARYLRQLGLGVGIQGDATQRALDIVGEDMGVSPHDLLGGSFRDEDGALHVQGVTAGFFLDGTDLKMTGTGGSVSQRREDMLGDEGLSDGFYWVEALSVAQVVHVD